MAGGIDGGRTRKEQQGKEKWVEERRTGREEVMDAKVN